MAETVSSGFLCIDFRPELVAVESIALKNLTTGSISRSFFGYSAGWFYVHFPGDEGTWQIVVNTLDGGHYASTFYFNGSGGGTPGGGYGYDNAY